MLDFWKEFLVAQGASFVAGRVYGFGSASPADAAGTVLADLSHFKALSASGDDRATFLQGQLTSDVHAVSLEHAQWAGYCTPKGRLLATLLLWRDSACHYLLLPDTLAAPIRKRLAMFVLRSKVKLADVSADSIRIGIAGADAGAVVARVWGSAPQQDMDVIAGDAGHCIRLSADRYLLALAAATAQATWLALAQHARPAGNDVWELLAIRAGEPLVLPATQEEFVPQMVNLDLIGGISFQKGCYTGQEIVARTRYLGKLKRRTYRAQVAADGVAPGDHLYSADFGGQASGIVLRAAPSPDGGSELLAVIQIESANAQTIHWRSLDGPALMLRTLPYALA